MTEFDIAGRRRPPGIADAARRGPLLFLAATLALLAAGPACSQENHLSQRAVLYNEDPSNPQGQQYVGSVVWHTAPAKTAGQPDDVAVKADVDIPAAGLKLTMSFRRNTDQSLPASHLIELAFKQAPGSVNGSIDSVPGVLMKSAEQARGVPLSGLSVKVTDGYFLFGLADGAAARAKNLESLLGRAWIDVPVIYSNKRRGIVAVEKGLSGEKAFRVAFGGLPPMPAPMPVPTSMPVPAKPGTGFVVQVSSQLSEADAQASFSVLRGKYPDLLGSRAPIIKRVDSGGNRAFYRAAVGSFETIDDAQQFCDKLKANGGQCLVQKN
jgi:hypothetical protein